MKKHAKLLLSGFIAVLAITALAAPSFAQAKDPDNTSMKRATYDAFELSKNLAGPKLSLENESVERLTFKVRIDEEGDVASLTYTHNVTSLTDQAIQRYIKNAYDAIMDTDFEAATKDGKPVKDTLTITFEVTG